MTNKYFQYWSEKEKREAKSKEIASRLQERRRPDSPLSKFIGWAKKTPERTLSQTLKDVGGGLVRGSSEPIPTLKPLVEKLPEGMPQEIAGSLTSPLGLASLAAAPFTGGGTLAARLGAGAVGKSLATETALNVGGVLGAHAVSSMLPEDAPAALKVALPLVGGFAGAGGLAAGVKGATKTAISPGPLVTAPLPGDQLYKLVLENPNALRSVVEKSPSLAKGVLGSMLRAIDPTLLDLNTTKGKIMAAYGISARQQEIGVSLTNKTMSKIRASGPPIPIDSAGLYKGFTSILPTGMSRSANDVMENLGKYQQYMDPRDFQQATLMKEAIDEMWEILQKRGIKTGKTDMNPQKSFFPRIVETLSEVAVEKDKPSYRFSGRNRVFVEAADAMGLAETTYFAPEVVTEAYLRAGYNLIADHELSSFMVDNYKIFAPSELVADPLKKTHKFAMNNQLRARRAFLKAQESGDTTKIQQAELRFNVAKDLKNKAALDVRKAIENLRSGDTVVRGDLITKTGLPEKTVLKMARLGNVPSALTGKLLPEDVVQQIEKNVKDVAARWETPGLGSKVIVGAEQFGKVSRIGKLSLDFARPLIQDLPMLARRPDVWAKQTMSMFRAAIDPGWVDRYLARPENQEIADLFGPYGLQIFGKSRPITDVGEAISVLNRGPKVVKSVFTRLQEMFEVPGDVGRIELAKALRHLAKNEEDLYGLAQYINEMTGVVSSKALGIGAGQRQIENTAVFLAPRYRRAVAAIVADAAAGIGDIAKANVRLLDPSVRESLNVKHMQALRSLTQLAAGTGLVYTAIAELVDQEPDFDPRSGGFLTLTVGDAHIGVGTTFKTVLRLVGSGVATAQDDPTNLVKFWDVEKNPILRTFRQGAAPATTTVLDILTGKTSVGEPLDTPMERALQVPRGMVPMVLEAALLDRSGAPAIIGEAGGGLTFPISLKEARNREVEQRDIIINSGTRKGQIAKKYEDLPESQQRQIDALPAVQKVMSRQNIEPGSSLAYKKESQDIGEKRLKVMTAIDKTFADDPQGWRDAREKYLIAVGQQYKDLREKYSDLFDEFEESDDPDKVMLAEWYDIFSDPSVVDPDSNQVNFDLMQQKIDNFKREHGTEGMEYIEKNTGFYRSPKEQEFNQDKKVMDEYWEIADEVFFDVSLRFKELAMFDDYNEATVAASQDPLLRRSAGWRALTKAIEKAHNQYLKENPDVREILIKWGYRDVTLSDIGMSEPKKATKIKIPSL